MNLAALKGSLRALNSRNYRLFFTGQIISLVGTWMQRVAMGWLIYRLTDSPFLLGFIGFTGLVPTFLLAPVTGVLADRWDRHRIMIATQVAAMLQAAALAALVLAGAVEVWHLVALSLFLGVVSAFDVPARQSFVVEMIERREDLGNAIALNSMTFNISRLIGPSLAGVLTAAVGEWLCFLLNAVSFIAVIAGLLAMRLPRREIAVRRQNVVAGIREGWSYAWANAPIRSLLILLAAFSLFGMPYMTLMPIFARDILRGGPQTFGFLLAVTGIGALVAGLWLASRKVAVRIGPQIPLAAALFGASLIAFGVSTILGFSLLLAAFLGFGQILQTTSTNTIIQTMVDEDKRGRMMSLYTMSLMGTAPFGSLLAGSMADALGAERTLVIDGAICLVAAFLFARMLPRLREAPRPVSAPTEA